MLRSVTTLSASLWLALLPSAEPALAASYYVNDASTVGDAPMTGCGAMGTGSDVPGCGTCSTPCRSPQYAYDRLALTAGDTVFINTGTYSGVGTAPILVFNDGAKSGTDAAPLTF